MTESWLRVTRATALVLSLAVLGACDAGEEDDLDIPIDTVGATAPAAGTAPASGQLTDPQIAQVVLVLNSADSATGALAQQKAQNAEVKQFGQRMATDHGTLNTQTRELAQRLGVTPEESQVSRDLQSTAQQTSQRLQGLSGAEFDRAYIDHEVQLHQQAIQLIDQQLLPAAQNADLKKLLQDARPILEAHLQRARQVQSSVGGGTGAQPARQ